MSKGITQLWSKRLIVIVILGLGFYFVPNIANAAELSVMGGATYFGGSSYETIVDIERDTVGNIYVIGITESSDLPTVSPTFDSTSNGTKDIFIAKFSSDLLNLLGKTYLGGSSIDDVNQLSITNDGNVLISGITYSVDFPTTNGAYDTTNNGGGDAYILKINSSLTTLLASTFIGGSDGDSHTSFDIDNSGNVYLGVSTWSKDYPTINQPYQANYVGGKEIALSKFDNTLSNLLISTYFGGSESEELSKIKFNADKSILYVLGGTNSIDLPVSADAYDLAFNGNQDMFVSGLDLNLNKVLFSSYLGGEKTELPSSLSITSDGKVLVLGQSGSSIYPVTADAFAKTKNGTTDLVLSKLSSDLKILEASTYLGGSGPLKPNSAGMPGIETAGEIFAASNGYIYIIGSTQSADFPIVGSNVFDSLKNGIENDDVIVAKMTDNLSLVESTFLGGTNTDYGNSLILTPDKIYLAGNTYSSDFITSSSSYDSSYNGNGDGFIVYFSFLNQKPINKLPVLPSQNLVEQGKNLNMLIPGKLPSNYTSKFRTKDESSEIEVVPLSTQENELSTLNVYSTSLLKPDEYSLKIEDTTGNIIAESSIFSITAPQTVVYKLTTDKLFYNNDELVTVSVYPGLYAIDKIKDGTFKIRWKNSSGILLSSITPSSGPLPSDGFSLFINYLYPTTSLSGKYTVQLYDSKTRKILDEKIVDIILKRYR